MSQPADELNFEEALVRLEAVVRDLESIDTGLDKSLVRYEEGVRLLKRCRAILDEAERKIRILTRLDANGNPVTEAYEVGEVAADSDSSREQSVPAKRTMTRAPRRSNAEPPDRGEQLF
jgi:exodeoxyribonuclease VII small subunit